MNGVYIIIFVLVVGIWYSIKAVQHSRLRRIENNKKIITDIKSSSMRWLSIIICIVATAILERDIIIAGRLTGAGLAQSDFGIFFDFIVYVIPSILLVVICVYYRVKYLVNKTNSLIYLTTDPFTILSVIAIFLPIIFFIFR
jgi:hypothetical protein